MKKLLIIFIVLLSVVITVSGCGKKQESQNITPEITQSESQQKIASEEPEKKQPNALNYMAPGYKQAQDKLKQVQDIRQQALDEHNNNIETDY